jgi:hypothetical protein
MEIPSLPTDNLYKFVALTGVLGIVLILYFYINQRSTLRKELNDQLLNIELSGLDTTLLNIKQHDVDQRLLSFAAFIAEKYPEDISRRKVTNDFIKEYKTKLDTISEFNWMYYLILKHPQYMPLISQLLETNIEYKEYAVKSLKLNREHKYQVDALFHTQELLNKLKLSLIAGLIVCVGLTILGFWLWYYRVQVYQDQILKDTIKLTKKK